MVSGVLGSAFEIYEDLKYLEQCLKKEADGEVGCFIMIGTDW